MDLNILHRSVNKISKFHKDVLLTKIVPCVELSYKAEDNIQIRLLYRNLSYLFLISKIFSNSRFRIKRIKILEISNFLFRVIRSKMSTFWTKNFTCYIYPVLFRWKISKYLFKIELSPQDFQNWHDSSKKS